ncbi:cupin domain-containing protein [Roseomonas sp. KE2513]|uniref:cupin domain-containing protein n=1 Tax=Roseomonas sp. KE2513 TaxID=2479202 RepID=UPI0018E007F8|nr:cupin domain-containing protein [Roseomonas sp. KE2513]MBI0538744.1 cupin domain-containing protein [Roseomonas sp. KE2513]
MEEQSEDALLVRATGRTFDIAGAHLVWKARAEETGGNFCFFEQTLSPGEGVPPHRHSYTEVFYVLAGTLRFRDHAGQTFSCSVGQTVIASPEVAHSFYNDGPELVRLLSIAPAAHQTFFDAVEKADQIAPFAGISPFEAMTRVGMIGAETDTRFEQASDLA